MSFCRRIQRVLRFQTPCPADWKPWQKAKAILLAIGQGIFRFAVFDVVTVLHTNDGNNFACPLDFFRLHVRQSDVPNLPGVFHLLNGAERFFQGHFWIDTMQLIHVDSLQAQSLQTAIDSLFQMFWPSVWYPLAGARPS